MYCLQLSGGTEGSWHIEYVESLQLGSWCGFHIGSGSAFLHLQPAMQGLDCPLAGKLLRRHAGHCWPFGDNAKTEHASA